MSRGRGRGVLFSKDLFDTPSTVPLREREDPTVFSSQSSSDSEDEDDFISSFRKLHPNASSTCATSSSSPITTSSASPVPQVPGVAVGRGRGRGTHRGRGLLDSEVLQHYPAVDPSMIKTPRLMTTKSPHLSPATSSTSRTSDERSSSSSFGEVLDRRIVIMKGERGQGVSLCANFMRLNILKNTGMYEYHVEFEPPIEARRLKRQVLKKSDVHIGSVINFDGAKLYLPIRLAEKLTVFIVPHPVTQSESVEVSIKYVKKNELSECTHFYNVLLRRVMDKLGYIEMMRNFYDYHAIFQVPEHKLEIWPGFVTAVDIYEDGLMLCCDSTFRVLRTSTLLDILYQMRGMQEQSRQYDYRKEFSNYVISKRIVTKYNNKHYKIDDVIWDQTPLSTFPRGKYGQEVEISFVDYYKQNYNQPINDFDQPMLLSRGRVRRQINVNDFTPPTIDARLVPELCYVTGMTEEITSDFRIMKVVAEKTRIPPSQRYNALEKFIKSVNNTLEVRQIFEEWGLELADGLVNLNGRVICPPTIMVKSGGIKPFKGDFGKDLLKSKILEPIPVSEWLLVCTAADNARAQKAIQHYAKVAPPLGIPYRGDPHVVRVQRASVPEFRRALVDNIKEGVTQFVMVIIPTNRDDLYQVVKQVCVKEVPIASQVIRGITLNDERKTRSVMQKVALQINCKLGGSLWTISIPLQEKIMFLGMDVYHDPSRRNKSVTAVVANINAIYTRYYTRVIFQQSQQENISSLQPVLIEALQTFCQENGGYPDRVIMFRDGVGDGQLQLTKEHEVEQILSSFKILGFDPKFTFCVVQKRIKTRLFLMQGNYIENPEPGTVMDHAITRRHHYDFFLVSQLIREGTVNPTHYIVLHDNSSILPDHMQRFAYATSFMYYNWSGSIRVPAMCQYAHKAASLVGQHLRSEPSAKMADKLYYL